VKIIYLFVTFISIYNFKCAIYIELYHGMMSSIIGQSVDHIVRCPQTQTDFTIVSSLDFISCINYAFCQ